jgi:hypothetical protein
MLIEYTGFASGSEVVPSGIHNCSLEINILVKYIYLLDFFLLISDNT